MNEKPILEEMQKDLRLAPAEMVIYLEGKNDPASLFALLGHPRPADDLHRGVLVKGLKDPERAKGSGAAAVKNRVEIATKYGLRGVRGVLDGDGLSLETLAPEFDAPSTGPLFRWKAYCVENLLVKTGWPSAWGSEPDWIDQLSGYAPYTAINCLQREIRSTVEDLGVARYAFPTRDNFISASEFSEKLRQGRARLQSLDVVVEFDRLNGLVLETIRRDLDEAHTLLNGKWLVEHLAPTLSSWTRSKEQCRFDWLAYAASVGGLAEVRQWWERVTGLPP